MENNIVSNSEFQCHFLNEEQWCIFQKLLITLSDSQMIWISGYLSGLVVNYRSNLSDTIDINDRKRFDQNINTELVSKISSSISCITILSASQTGNARELSVKFYNLLLSEQFDVRLVSAVDYNFKKISQEKIVFLIISTYGEGEPPEEAVLLYKYLFSKNAPSLKGIYFSVFGLGDRSYENFSKASKDFDCRLEQLGASRLYYRVDADVDYQKKADEWRKAVIGILKSRFMLFTSKSVIKDHECVTKKVVTCSSNVYTKDAPFVARLLVRKKITSSNSIKDVYHLEMDLSGSEICYKPGDSLGIWYENDPNLVSELLEYCRFTGKEEINIYDGLIPFNTVLQKYYELTHNTPSVAKKYATVINNRELLSLFIDGDALKKFVFSTSIIDMIRRWSPQNLIPEQLLSVLRLLTPRYYSISCSQEEVGEEVHITVGVVRYEVDGRIRSGGASGYLVDRLPEGSELRIFVVSNESFRLPFNSDKSMIMVASGTGIAPFRAFMQQRLLDGASGKNWLFFGNLSFLDDFLYQREWQQYYKDGILTNINTAWSRDQKDKVYVQDKILQYGSEVWTWIKNGAYVYVCGNASHMARDVEKSLIKLGVEYGKMTLEESRNFLNDMRIDHRYQRDIY